MDFIWLCEQLGLGDCQTAEPLKAGTTARVWRLATDRGLYLVRTLSGHEQGVREEMICRHLLEKGFTAAPALLGTVEDAGQWYQVQEYVSGTMPDPTCPGVAAAMADLALELKNALADAPGGPVIHGDLGPWNLLQRTDGVLMVIDFGETGAGDPCFDYATLLGGIINHTPEELRAAVCREYVCRLDCGREQLLSQLRLWAAQGVERWTGRNEKMVSRFYHALSWAEEYLYDL